MAMRHLLASPVSPLNCSGKAALMSTMLLSSLLSERESIQMGKGKPGSEELRELGGEGVIDGAGRSKYCVCVRSPEGVVDHEW